MANKSWNWFPFWVFIIAFFVPLSQSLFFYFWDKGWFGEVSMLPPIFAYIGIGLSLFFGFSGATAIVIAAVMWFKHRNDPDPIELLIEAMNKRFDKVDNKLDTLGKKGE